MSTGAAEPAVREEPIAQSLEAACAWPYTTITALPALKPDLQERAWQSIPHPILPLLATAHQKSVTIFSLSTLSSHSTLTGGHNRSVRSVAWKPNAGAGQLCLVTGSFDSTAGLWRYDNNKDKGGIGGGAGAMETEVTSSGTGKRGSGNNGDDQEEEDEDDWEFTLVLEGHDSEVKSVSFSPAGQYLATCSRDKSVWIWEDVGPGEVDDEWETVAVLNEHDGDVKAVAWCPEIKNSGTGATLSSRYSSEVLASASYDDTIRIWREDNDGEWVCVAVLEGHKGTVWGLQWEPNAAEGRFPRLMSWSADRTIRLWSLKEEPEEEAISAPAPHAWSGALGGIPNTMRRSLKEEWLCTATLPACHEREIYTVSWSTSTGRVASSGSDGKIGIYAEAPASIFIDKDEDNAAPETTDAEAAAELDGDIAMGGSSDNNKKQTKLTHAQQYDHELGSKRWKIIGSREAVHGPYEVNHITWCKRFDKACKPENRGVEEMLVTTGDDGVIRPWRVEGKLPGST